MSTRFDGETENPGMNGGPSQMDLWDYKPNLNENFDKDLPDCVRMGQRLTTMTSGQARFPIARRSTNSPSTARPRCC